MGKKMTSILALVLVTLGATAQSANILHDAAFAGGFTVYCTDPDTDTVSGRLISDSTATAVWNLRQYNSRFDMAQCTLESFGSRYTFSRAGNGNLNAKTLTVNHSRGSLNLECNASAEYTGIRRAETPWVYMTVDAPTDTVRMGQGGHLRMNFSFRETLYEDCMGFLADKDLHAAVYRVFIRLRNRNVESGLYGRQMRLGMVIFDNRYMGLSRTESVSASEQEGALFDYYAPTSRYLAGGKLPKVRQKGSVNADLEKMLADAIEAAQAARYLGESSPAEWEIVGCDLGWEMTGTYNAALEVRDIAITH